MMVKEKANIKYCRNGQITLWQWTVLSIGEYIFKRQKCFSLF